MISRLMKDSGIKWVGKVPQNWVVNKVRYFMAEKSIKNHPDEMVLSLYRDYGIVPKDSRDDNHNVTSLNTSTYKLVEKNQLVINKMKAWQGSLAISKHRGIVSPAYYIFDIVKDNLLPEFLHYAFRNSAYIDEYKRLSTGIRPGQWDLNKDQFKNISYSYPVSLHEQQKIASFLDEKVAHIDNILEDTKKSIEYLKAYKQSLITETVTKGLNANVEMKDTGIEWIGQIPKHWVLSKIKYRVSLRNEKDPYKIGDKYIGLEHIESNNGRIHSYDEDYNGGLTDKFKSGDVLFSKLRPYLAKGFIASFDGYCSGELLTFKEVEGDKRYFLYYILSGNFIDAINASTYGTKMPRANWDYIKELPIPGLPIYEQQIIADILDEKTSHINRLIRNKEKMVEELESYKKSLIYEYVTGKKEVQ